MIDRRGNHFLDSIHFGRSGIGGRHAARVLLLCCLAVSGTCCSPERAPGTVEESLTSGRMSVVCSAELLPVIRRERAAFDSLYPEAAIEIREGTSSEAIRALFAAESELAVISRELEPFERRAAVTGGLELEGFRFARDGVALVVHPANPVENVALDEVRGVYEGTITRWSDLGGAAAAIRPVIQPPGSDIMAYFAARVMDGGPIGAAVVYGASDSGVVAYVARHPEAIGIVSLAWAERGVRPLRLAALKGMPYWRPDLEAVHRGDYPLSRDMNLYLRPDGRPLAKGMVTFITSREGQAIVRDAGLVPTAVPVRFVRRSPMLGGHQDTR